MDCLSALFHMSKPQSIAHFISLETSTIILDHEFDAAVTFNNSARHCSRMRILHAIDERFLNNAVQIDFKEVIIAGSEMDIRIERHVWISSRKTVQQYF